jgi:hypothetical protein
MQAPLRYDLMEKSLINEEVKVYNRKLNDLTSKYRHTSIMHIDLAREDFSNVKFLGVDIESTCTWKMHIAKLLPKLDKACYLMRVIKPIMPIETMKIVY